MPTTTYREFIEQKVNFDKTYGHHIDVEDIHPILKPHQRDIVQWAVQGGRRAIFAAFGLGKSVMQLETLKHTLAEHGGMGLIICPLGVRQEFAHDAQMLDTSIQFIRSIEETTGEGLYITNYETVRDGKLDPNEFTAVSLDEASVLRSFGSKTYQTFLTLFEKVPYRFVATATPSPNRYKELIHYAGFLGVMDTGQALTRFFQRDSKQANNLTLYPHKEREFWLWLNTWAIFLQSPADLGHDATGYDLPPLGVQWHEVGVDHGKATVERDGQAHLFRGGNLSLPEQSREKRETLPQRVARAVELATHVPDGDQMIVWCDLNAEQDALERALTAEGITFSSVYGALPVEETERRIQAWKNRETRALIGKPVMLGQGLNLQQCNVSIYVGITDKFNDLIQSIHRIQRFGQTRPCTAHIIHAESETAMLDRVREKWQKHEELTRTMTAVIREHGLNQTDINAALTRGMGVDRITAEGDGWFAANNDCVQEARLMEENSVGLIVTSIPFANHYEYTPNYNDFGHTDNNDHFWGQMDYLTPELLRVLQPGRIYACHVKDRINFGNVTGAGIPTSSPFHAEAIMHATKHGFDYMGMITVVTDVVRENNQTYRLGYTEMCKDGTKMGVGSPEYILLFHKPQTDRTRGYADTPVTKAKDDYSLARWQVDAHAFWRSSGNRNLTPDELAALPVEQRSRVFTQQTLEQVYDFDSHVSIGEKLYGRGALPATFMSLAPGSWHPEVWHDVNRMRTLNGDQKARNLQMHVCPLQLDIVDRLITRYSNEGDLVFDPFGGLGTVARQALLQGRRGRTVELNTGYFLDAVKYLEAAERDVTMPTLFDALSA
ncbi:hypothetical protein M3C26_06940 [Kocuria rhizophila]|uniref:DNA methyltransferase n=1 Tax=Kocuria rhizophila TaxID=72000 RepID=UPI0021A3876A|nr:DNA methyltransferase [Kocuria rhizophila]MCT1880526.1 hypothetical protein [Kocuria rhizophila]